MSLKGFGLNLVVECPCRIFEVYPNVLFSVSFVHVAVPHTVTNPNTKIP